MKTPNVNQAKTWSDKATWDAEHLRCQFLCRDAQRSEMRMYLCQYSTVGQRGIRCMFELCPIVRMAKLADRCAEGIREIDIDQGDAIGEGEL